jgi:hypothetical protein
MSQSILAIQPWWATQSPLTALVSASAVWLGVAGDVTQRPYVIIGDTSQEFDKVFGRHQIQRTKFSLEVFDTTLASVDAITTQIVTSLGFSTAVTGHTMTVIQEGEIETAETPGGYSAKTSWTLWEAF